MAANKQSQLTIEAVQKMLVEQAAAFKAEIQAQTEVFKAEIHALREEIASLRSQVQTDRGQFMNLCQFLLGS